MSATTNGLVFIPDGSHAAFLGETLAIRLRKPAGAWDNGDILYDNIKLKAVPPPPAGTVIMFR
jgi:hypothetical protein